MLKDHYSNNSSQTPLVTPLLQLRFLVLHSNPGKVGSPRANRRICGAELCRHGAIWPICINHRMESEAELSRNSFFNRCIFLTLSAFEETVSVHVLVVWLKRVRSRRNDLDLKVEVTQGYQKRSYSLGHILVFISEL